MREILVDYLNIFVERKIYPFAPLEVNFLINFTWLVLKSMARGKSEYRFSGGISAFLEYRVVTFMLSFLVMFLILISLDFWLKITKLASNYILFLPSLIAILLAELSGLLAGLLNKKEGANFEEQEIIITTRELTINFILAFLLLGCFWTFILYTNF